MRKFAWRAGGADLLQGLDLVGHALDEPDELRLQPPAAAERLFGLLERSDNLPEPRTYAFARGLGGNNLIANRIEKLKRYVGRTARARRQWPAPHVANVAPL